MNDLALLLVRFSVKIFVNDTTLITFQNDLQRLVSAFKNALVTLTEWCEYNKMDINWSKTYFMFVTNKR